MRYPNAAAGIKKVQIGAILDLVALIGLVAFEILGTGLWAMGSQVASSDAVSGAAGVAGVSSLVLFVFSLILPVIATVLQIVGLKQAGKDGSNHLKSAFIFAIANLVLEIASSAIVSLISNRIVVAVPRLIQQITLMGMYVYTIYGVIEMARELEEKDVASLGRRCITLLMIALITATVLSGVLSFATPESQTGTAVVLMLSVIANALAIISVGVFVVFLARGRSMLERN